MEEKDGQALAQLVPFPPLAVLSTYQLAPRALFIKPTIAKPSTATQYVFQAARIGRLALVAIASREKR
jgi:hypothetical protein